jgi:hypothetical protein
MTRVAPHHPLVVASLIDRGDRACADRDPDALVAVIRQLEPDLPSTLQAEVTAVAELAVADLAETARRWSAVARCLRDWAAASLVHRG